LESGGNNMAIGDSGKARGPLQIHACVVQDANRISGRSYQWSRMTNRAEATEVCRIYLTHYATPERIGRPVTNYDAARIWNAGPDGWRQTKATAGYISKLKKKGIK
jgi:hypothetical protein